MNYLRIEALLRARIEASVAGLKAVLGAADLAGVSEAAQITPAVHVLYDGDEVVTRGGDSVAVAVNQRWLVVVAVRNVRNQATGDAARAEAGELIWEVLRAVQGWQPAADLGPLARVNGPAPAYISGFAYFPLAFNCLVPMTGLEA